MNITNIDDKTIKGSQKEGKQLKEFTHRYEEIFLKDILSKNIIKPGIILRATESIPEMISLIQQLIKKGYAYEAEDGIYYSIDKFRSYGKLAGKKQKRNTNATS